MQNIYSYAGVIVPMITPLHEDYSVDRKAVGRMIGLFLENGVSPFVAGTTGEASSLSAAQKEILVSETVRQVSGKTTVYAGIAGNCLSDSVEAAKRYAGVGADVLVANLPSYYPLTDSDMLRYWEQLAEACPVPLILYNIPGTTKLSVPLPVLEKLSHHPNIAGVKDSERDQDRMNQALLLWKDRADFICLIGWAARSSHALLHGAKGIVPSTGNFAPGLYARLSEAARSGDEREAGKWQELTNRLSVLYQEGRNLSGSLAALKVIMSVKGLCGTQMMPPIYRMDAAEEKRYRVLVAEELDKMGILNADPGKKS